MPIACITGASSGIGKEFARRLDEEGYKLILAARSEDKLKEVQKNCKNECRIITADLSKRDECVKLGDLLAKEELDVFINNAGFGCVEDFDKSDLDNDLRMIDVNVTAMQILFRKVLPGFVERDRGMILNVASSAGLLYGGPYMATYYATKAYVTSLTSAVYRELRSRGSHVKISMLCPGPVDTNFNNVANAKFALSGITPEYCVDYALKGMKKGKLTIVPNTVVRTGVTFGKFLPHKVQLAIVQHQQSKKR